MPLTDLSPINYSFNSIDNNIPAEFYVPCLKKCQEYKRAVGFFSSGILLLLTDGLGTFAKNGGKMKLLVSPRLDESDYEAIKKGYNIKEILKNKTIESFDFNINFDQRDDRFALLSSMIANDLLEIKVVCMTTFKENAMFHVKKGVFIDSSGNKIYFNGSANETPNAMYNNYEEINVTCSRDSYKAEQICDKENDNFNYMRNGNKNGLVTIPFPEVIEKKLMSYNKNGKTDFQDIDSKFNEYIKNCYKPKALKIPSCFQMREYQKKAVENWKNNNYVGIFDMATGTGKTKTACFGMCEIFSEVKRMIICIAVPSKTLVEQWYDELLNFNVTAIKYYSDQDDDYKKKLKRSLINFKQKNTNLVCIIITNKSFLSDNFQSIIKDYAKQTLLIVDEAHNFGAEKISKTLEIDYKYRLALSATFDRYNDKKGTEKLYDFFQKKCIELSLEEAIEKGFLTKYKYYPIIVNLNENELENYIELSKKIGKLMNINSDSTALEKLLIKRARIVASAENKIESLLKELEKYKKKHNMLIYCGVSNIDEEVCGEEKKEIDFVIEEIYNKLGIIGTRFTSRENSEERKRILNAYKNKDIQCLVAIKCLDEGIDIPSIRTAFILASCTNPREYIQRRGRVLRKDENKEYAEIYDFIVIPHHIDYKLFKSDENLKIKQSLVYRELKRMNEFSKIAINSAISSKIEDDLKDKYRLNDFDEREDIYGKY